MRVVPIYRDGPVRVTFRATEAVPLAEVGVPGQVATDPALDRVYVGVPGDPASSSWGPLGLLQAARLGLRGLKLVSECRPPGAPPPAPEDTPSGRRRSRKRRAMEARAAREAAPYDEAAFLAAQRSEPDVLAEAAELAEARRPVAWADPPWRSIHDADPDRRDEG